MFNITKLAFYVRFNFHTEKHPNVKRKWFLISGILLLDRCIVACICVHRSAVPDPVQGVVLSSCICTSSGYLCYVGSLNSHTTNVYAFLNGCSD